VHIIFCCFFFFFSSRRRHTRLQGDWSSDVCSSDLKKEVGKLTPGTAAWQEKFGRLLGCRDPHARLSDMDALGTDQVMLFPTWFVRLALVRSAEAATILARAYNDWVLDYCAADRRRLFPCAVLPLQSVEASIAELRRIAALGFKAAAVRPCFW